VLHCAAVCCSVLQCVEVCCSVLSCHSLSARRAWQGPIWMALLHKRKEIPRIEYECACWLKTCSWKKLQTHSKSCKYVMLSELQRTLTHRNTLQHTATHCNISHYDAFASFRMNLHFFAFANAFYDALAWFLWWGKKANAVKFAFCLYHAKSCKSIMVCICKCGKCTYILNDANESWSVGCNELYHTATHCNTL